jgi:hypothetical protein
VNAGPASAAPIGGDEHGRGELVDAAGLRDPRSSGHLRVAVGDPVGEHHVGHEGGAVGEGEEEPDGVGYHLERREQGDSAHGHAESDEVANRPHPEGGQDHRSQELDRPDGREGKPGDGQVEDGVHYGEEDAKCHQF